MFLTLIVMNDLGDRDAHFHKPIDDIGDWTAPLGNLY
jgi:hypothetical protein